jgi:hypothetical protein
VRIEIAGVVFKPTLVSISDISAFLQTFDINRLFGSLHIAPLVEDVKVSIPLLGEASLSSILLMFGDGTLGSLTGHIEGYTIPIEHYEYLQLVASVLYAMAFIFVVWDFKRFRKTQAVLHLTLIVLFSAVYINLVMEIRSVAMLEDEMLRTVFSVTKESIIHMEVGTVLFVAGMAGSALTLIAESIYSKRRHSLPSI